MDVNGMIAELRAELEQIDEAILALERIASGSARRRGRPPKWLTAVREKQAPEVVEPPAAAAAPAKGRKKRKRVLSAEARQRMAEAQRRRWAATKGDDSSSDS